MGKRCMLNAELIIRKRSTHVQTKGRPVRVQIMVNMLSTGNLILGLDIKGHVKRSAACAWKAKL